MINTGAQILIDTLIANDIRQIFTLSGNHIMAIFDAALERKMELIHVRHETAAVHMADAWGRLTGQPGITLVTAGPGHANTISALYVAQMAESPLVLLSGHAPLSQRGKGSFQEVDQVQMAEPVSKASWLVEDAATLQADVRRAIQLATSDTPGPVHLSIPSDVLEASIDKSASISYEEPTSSAVDITSILDMLTQAKKPLLVAGPALSRGIPWQNIKTFSSNWRIPALPMRSPRGLNDPALKSAVNSIREADLILLLGKKLDFTLRFGEGSCFRNGCQFVAVVPPTDQILNDDRITDTIFHNPIAIVDALNGAPNDEKSGDAAWYESVRLAQETVPETWKSLRESIAGPIHPLAICQAIQPYLDDGAIFVSDGGEFGQWVQAGLSAEISLINGPSGSIGSAIPLAIGAKKAYPNQIVFACLGDGTFGFHPMEMDTALRYDLPIVCIVGNDARWNAEHQIQLRQYGADRTGGCDLLPTRYDQMVSALGGYGEFVETPRDIGPAIARAIASNLPACVNIMIESHPAPTLLNP
ncbi:MAG: thiamine pyrophosphate-binding protein [Chloroflexota bacterium]